MANFLYSAFSLLVESNRFVPGLLAASVNYPFQADIQIDLVGDDRARLPDGVRRELFTSPFTGVDDNPIVVAWSLNAGEFYRLLYDDGTEFVVDNAGSRVWGSWPEHLRIEDTAPFITGPILGLALRLRGIVCLHASAVLIAPGCAVAFVGPAGAGKSTIAASFAQLGYPILSDDIVALDADQSGFCALPAHPTIRLWDKSVKALFGNESALPRIAPDDPTWTKRYLPLGSEAYQFRAQPERLVGLYMLDDRNAAADRVAIGEALPRENLVTLVNNTYMNYLIDKSLRAHEFDVLSRLVQTVPIRRMVLPDSIASVAAACVAIISDLEAAGFCQAAETPGQR